MSCKCSCKEIVYTTPGSYEQKICRHIKTIKVIMWAGGAGGTSGAVPVSLSANASGGGGAGTYLEHLFKLSEEGEALFIIVGKGGLGGTSGTMGIAGENSSVSFKKLGFTLVAIGGQPSALPISSTNLATTSIGGEGGMAISSPSPECGFGISGQNGQPGMVDFSGGELTSGTLNVARGGNGGASYAGYGGWGGSILFATTAPPSLIINNGTDGGLGGGGGSGAAVNLTSGGSTFLGIANGGNGGNGLVKLILD